MSLLQTIGHIFRSAPSARSEAAPAANAALEASGSLGPDQARLGVQEAFDPARLKTVLDGTFGAAGLTAKTHFVPATRGIPFLHVRPMASLHGKIYAPDGTKVGKYHYSLRQNPDGTRSVYHHWIKLKREYQGTGFGKAFTEHAENGWRELGVRDVKLHAALTVGGYNWARRGFEIDVGDLTGIAAEEARRHTVRSLLTDAVRNKRITQDEFNDLWGRTSSFTAPSDAIRGARDLAALPEGKRVMLGSNWYGIKYLNDA